MKFGKKLVFLKTVSIFMMPKRIGGVGPESLLKCRREKSADQILRCFTCSTLSNMIRRMVNFAIQIVIVESFLKLVTPFLYNIKKRKMEHFRSCHKEMLILAEDLKEL